jgi:cellulose synthase/poly-beta-1,6-N-acetylglucosamine synthase-like glycosyltransferase
MKKNPSVTVLVTVKNGESTIKKCVESLLKLDYPKYKIYITDAYSEDNTFKILKELKKKNSKKIKLERVRGNIAKAHNHMIKKVKSDLIAMTDADCVVDKNWLKYLTSAFKSEDIVASVGYCSTPKNVNKLQRLVGMELENRFKKFPKFVKRGPTMNFCVRTDLAKKIKFDERFDVAQETDWGYRLSEFGKIKYVPKARVYHYHRPTWRSFFKQQFKYGKHMPLLYLKHKKMSTGDHISKPSMILEEFAFISTCFFIILSIFNQAFILFIFLSLMILIGTYLSSILTLTKKLDMVIRFFALHVVRNIAWSLGLFVGIFYLFTM